MRMPNEMDKSRKCRFKFCLKGVEKKIISSSDCIGIFLTPGFEILQKYECPVNQVANLFRFVRSVIYQFIKILKNGQCTVQAARSCIQHRKLCNREGVMFVFPTAIGLNGNNKLLVEF